MITTKTARSIMGRAVEDKGMKRIKVVRGTVIKGHGPVSAGWVGDVEQRDAAELFRLGKAVPAKKQTRKGAKK